MILQHKPPLHLTYCLNIHPGESWAENLAAIREKAVRVKQFVAPDGWFLLRVRPGRSPRCPTIVLRREPAVDPRRLEAFAAAVLLNEIPAGERIVTPAEEPRPLRRG